MCSIQSGWWQLLHQWLHRWKSSNLGSVWEASCWLGWCARCNNCYMLPARWKGMTWISWSQYDLYKLLWRLRFWEFMQLTIFYIVMQAGDHCWFNYRHLPLLWCIRYVFMLDRAINLCWVLLVHFVFNLGVPKLVLWWCRQTSWAGC